MRCNEKQDERPDHRGGIRRVKPPQTAEIKLAPLELVASSLIPLSRKREMDAKSAQDKKQPDTKITPTQRRNKISEQPRRFRPRHNAERREGIDPIMSPDMVARDHK